MHVFRYSMGHFLVKFFNLIMALVIGGAPVSCDPTWEPCTVHAGPTYYLGGAHILFRRNPHTIQAGPAWDPRTIQVGPAHIVWRSLRFY